jgi:hypothetical protein
MILEAFPWKNGRGQLASRMTNYERDSLLCLPRNRSSHCKMDGGVSVQQGGGGCNAEEL